MKRSKRIEAVFHCFRAKQLAKMNWMMVEKTKRTQTNIQMSNMEMYETLGTSVRMAPNMAVNVNKVVMDMVTLAAIIQKAGQSLNN